LDMTPRVTTYVNDFHVSTLSGGAYPHMRQLMVLCG
jgi:hypothetical protein